MKIRALSEKLRPILPLLRCPLCSSSFSLTGQSLLCGAGHCFDLSAKGYVNLAPTHNQSGDKYTGELFDCRRQVFADGFYAPVLDAITALLERTHGNRDFSLMDVGCGEGYYARGLAQALPGARILGVDLNREAIQAAARGGNPVHWFVADLKRLPVPDGALDTVLDVLTPADYAEFRRVLAPGGELYKVVPGADYLREVRAAVSGHLRGGDAYDNGRVLTHLSQHAVILEHAVIHETFPLSQEQAERFLRMTPMTFSVPENALEARALERITIHLELLRCRMG